MTEETQAARERIEALTIAISVRSVPRIVAPLLRTALTIQQLKVLSAIVVDEGQTTSLLASKFTVTMATMSKLIDRLVAHELVERVPGSDDQRVRRLRATALGRKVVGELLGARPELGDDVLRKLSLAELAALETGLRAINRELQNLPPAEGGI